MPAYPNDLRLERRRSGFAGGFPPDRLEGAAMLISYLWLARWTALLALALISGYTDFRENKVYNWVSYPALILGFLLAATQSLLLRQQSGGQEVEMLVGALSGAFFCGGTMWLVYVMGSAGFGDVKLMAAAGMLAGFGMSIYILMFSTLTGAAIGISMVIWKGKTRELLRRSVDIRRLFRKQKLEESVQPVPFGVAFAGGCLWTLAMTFA